MSSVTTSGAGGAPAPFRSAAIVCAPSDVFTVAKVSLRFSLSSPPLLATGPSGGRIDPSMSARWCRSPGTGAVRPPRMRFVHGRCVLFASAVVIPGGKIVTSTHLARLGSVRFECGEGPLQEIERAAELGQLPRRGLGELRRELLGQGPLDERARGQTSVGQCQAEPPPVIGVRLPAYELATLQAVDDAGDNGRSDLPETSQLARRGGALSNAVESGVLTQAENGTGPGPLDARCHPPAQDGKQRQRLSSAIGSLVHLARSHSVLMTVPAAWGRACHSVSF